MLRSFRHPEGCKNKTPPLPLSPPKLHFFSKFHPRTHLHKTEAGTRNQNFPQRAVKLQSGAVKHVAQLEHIHADTVNKHQTDHEHRLWQAGLRSSRFREGRHLYTQTHSRLGTELR